MKNIKIKNVKQEHKKKKYLYKSQENLNCVRKMRARKSTFEIRSKIHRKAERFSLNTKKIRINFNFCL